MSQKRIALAGFGAFGQLIAQSLAPFTRLCVLDPSLKAQQQARALGLDAIAAEDLGAADLVVLAMPLAALAQALQQIAPHLRPGQIVLDVCSIKEEPARLMLRHLPEGIEIIASHPMFGPRSAASGLAGQQIVICPLRGKSWRPMARWLHQQLGLRVTVCTPEEHDRQAAMTQGLTHLLAHAIRGFGTGPAIRTRSFDLIMEGIAMVQDDAPEVYQAIIHGNRHIAPLRDRLIAALDETSKAGLSAPPHRSQPTRSSKQGFKT